VNRARAEAFRGSVYGQIESPPWSQILSSSGTATDTPFLLFNHAYYDRASQKWERLLGWAHPVLLNMLKQKKTSVFVDGTFRSVPPKFKQCLMFTTYDRPTKGYYPAVFVLGTSKKYEMYFHAMQHVLDATDYSMDPEFMYCDFEAGMIRSIRDHFPATQTIGCLFHFKQACRRKMKKYTISEQECSIAMAFGVLDMLTVIPQAKVKKQGIAWVKRKIASKCSAAGVAISLAKWARFWSYFDRTWLMLFPPRLWNVELYTRQLISRTNNPLERFNRELNDVFQGSHPNLPEFVAGIEKLARKYVNFKTDIELGRAQEPRRAPIRLPNPASLSEESSSSSEETKGDDADDSSDANQVITSEAVYGV